MYHNFIGIDISKADFHVNVCGETSVSVYPNDPNGFKQFIIKTRSKLKSGLVVLETTGGYELGLVNAIIEDGYCVHRANTRHVKQFIRSYGCLGKSDAIDAKGLARYGAERHEQLHLYQPQKRSELLSLVNRRLDLIQMRTQEKNRQKGPTQSGMQSSFDTVITVLNNEIERLETLIEQIVKKDELLQTQRKILKTIPGVGEIISLQLLCQLPELGLLDRRKIASLAGVAPHPNESGKKKGYRFTRGGRQIVKPTLFIAAMSASRSHSQLGQAYDNLLKRGKKKMVALTAIMRKILVIANAKLRDHYIEHVGGDLLASS